MSIVQRVKKVELTDKVVYHQHYLTWDMAWRDIREEVYNDKCIGPKTDHCGTPYCAQKHLSIQHSHRLGSENAKYLRSIYSIDFMLMSSTAWRHCHTNKRKVCMSGHLMS